VVKAGGASYDPSYGNGPYKGGGKPTTASVLKEYQEASIAGFCRPAKFKGFENPTSCQNAPKANQLVSSVGFP